MRRAIKFLLVLSICALPVFGQSSTGRLVGTVSDSSGVIPGATVVIKDNQTSKERNTTTSGEGTFSVSQLDVGSYTVTIRVPGHKVFSAADVKINIGQEYGLQRGRGARQSRRHRK